MSEKCKATLWGDFYDMIYFYDDYDKNDDLTGFAKSSMTETEKKNIFI